MRERERERVWEKKGGSSLSKRMKFKSGVCVLLVMRDDEIISLE